MHVWTRILIALISLVHLESVSAQESPLIVGTYTRTGSKGIYVYSFNGETGVAKPLFNTTGVSNPSFITLSKNKKFLYAVQENRSGAVSAFKFDEKNGQLQLINSVTTKGSDPCHLTTSSNARYLFVANYSGGNIVSYRVAGDGSLSGPIDSIQHKGSGPNRNRQSNAHPHGVFIHPKGKLLFVPDLGTDEVRIYTIRNKKNSILDTNRVKVLKLSPGAGPRHLTFSRSGNTLYVLEELAGSISVFDRRRGTYRFIQNVSMRPSGLQTVPSAADIHISPDGRFLYASNRGQENNIVQYEILKGGLLNTGNIKYYVTGGLKPRNFTMTKDGKWLLVANQDSNNIVIFSRNKENGDLVRTDKKIDVPMPVCLVIK